MSNKPQKLDKSITTREQDFSAWYLDVIAAADLADYAPVKGCMVIKPYGYAIWENIQKILDAKFKVTGVKNAYFPLLIPQSYLEREAEHVKGFAPETAVVTHAGGKKLDEPYVIRPTSETIIYDMFAKWVQSYRDLPLLINQWANIVRWEMRTRLFLRTTEFLWQEGHTAHATEKEADERALQMLEIYKDFAGNYLAMPVFDGIKSEAEKFAGAVRTYCIEAMMQDGKALQAGTSHLLGQNFAKVFNLKFLNQEGVEEFAFNTSWGVSTRLIGGLIMTHSDDKGLVLPPKIAPIQVMILPIWSSDEERIAVLDSAEKIEGEFKELDIRVEIDKREERFGIKTYEWEKKGVPVRIEIGPKDLAKKSAMVVRRDVEGKNSVEMSVLAKNIDNLLIEIQNNLFERARLFRNQHFFEVNVYEEFKEKIEQGFVKAPWCGKAECEAKIKEETKATVRCLPFDVKEEKGKCLICGQTSSLKPIFAKAY
ncbi:MAG: Proline-tRNA ligase [Candidatus Magasanikbacteria bacterium GW2011_GWC2_40_17]|uniref:Proline--tRNA ligase n=1 Tax=Candidatus Magasanikbacteria bacterium GW2011_GWA2_42_32 TaxID=1619039 RepID=A0A0G1A9I2_9BACT|nr:MAG: Proline-tRNA ligase [Candidatus Magasanikbacteria bacterium GW2011_GWC2_40_17]KKS57614.1 MAG: Proline-tRNA ligase [Candidatus Magasanikbacteria bacterium GW2011_GWA2_42_32]OGH85016.1 MAG: proline--tRNA ligase [Candidatus Magasanikbacteria bacterium RIFOXYB2_FULL_38_10]